MGSDSPRKAPVLLGVREKSRAKGGSCQGTDSGSTGKHIFHFFLIKQLIFNYKSEGGSPHETSYVIYQKKISLGRYGPQPRFKPGWGSGVSPKALVQLGQRPCVVTTLTPRNASPGKNPEQ